MAEAKVELKVVAFEVLEEPPPTLFSIEELCEKYRVEEGRFKQAMKDYIKELTPSVAITQSSCYEEIYQPWFDEVTRKWTH